MTSDVVDTIESLRRERDEAEIVANTMRAVSQMQIGELQERAESAEAENTRLRRAMQLADAALMEAEAILGGEYGDHYGPLCQAISDLRRAQKILIGCSEDDRLGPLKLKQDTEPALLLHGWLPWYGPVERAVGDVLNAIMPDGTRAPLMRNALAMNMVLQHHLPISQTREEEMSEPQSFEAYPKLAAIIEDIGWTATGISLSKWDRFLTEINATIDSLHRERDGLCARAETAEMERSDLADDNMRLNQACHERNAAKGSAESAEAENARLREALKPFAEASERYNDIPGVVRYDCSLELWQNGWRIDFITVGDLRRAQQALTGGGK